MIPLIVMFLSGSFMAIGGYCWKGARWFLIPLILVSYSLYITKDPWVLTQLNSALWIHLGYGDNSVYRHIFGDCWGRGVWGFITACSIAIPLMVTGHLAIPIGIAYCILSFFLEPLFKNLWQVAGDFIIGTGLSSVVCFIHYGGLI